MKVFVSQPLPEPSTTELLAGFEVVVGQPGSWATEAATHLPDADAVVPTPREPVTEALLALAPLVLGHEEALESGDGEPGLDKRRLCEHLSGCLGG